MTTKNQVVDKAREWIGTPFHHQGRSHGIGVDCIGLVIVVAQALGLKSRTAPEQTEFTGYSRVPHGGMLVQTMREHLVEIGKASMEPGDIVVVSYDVDPQHVGILGNYRHGGLSIIHAAGITGKVIETRLMFSRSMQFVTAFSLSGVVAWHS